MPEAPSNTRAQRLALLGLVSNLALAGIKLLAGVIGHSYALIADAIESIADIVGSVVIWGGLHISARPATEKHPYGYGKAEALAALAVAILIFAAGIGIAVEAVREIITPHHTPAWWTLVVLLVVVAVKETLFRAMRRVARDTESPAAETDAWHHRADAITSAAAFVGIGIAVVGKHYTHDDRFAPADDWAALLAAGIILFNAFRIMTTPVRELLDMQSGLVTERARQIASGVPGVSNIQKAFARKSGTRYWIDMHVWVDGSMSVRDAHALAHAVKDAVRREIPSVYDVLIHVEPARNP
ncbi:Manganese efflux system protein MneP [Phycisphaerales bacterium]|nr:Manganese efflux system protein MneP [Phycisphaerales bacterium]